MGKDILNQFKNMAICPACGCIDQKGVFRCLGCGTFHSGVHLVEREAPPVEQVSEPSLIDPSAYSLGPTEKIMEETFEQSEDVREWSGGSTDFSVDDDGIIDENKTNSKEKIPTPEEL